MRLAGRGTLGAATVLAALARAVSVAKADLAAVTDGVVAFSDKILGQLEAEKQANTLDEARALEIIRADASARFDFAEITRTAVGKYWRKADDAQRAQLTELFGALLEKTYSKTLAKFNGQEMKLLDSAERTEGHYAVRFVVAHEGKEFKVEYLAHDKDGDWRIFDVKVEGISLIASYRSQFSQVIRKQGVDALVGMLRERV